MPFRREAGRVVDAPRCQVLARFKVPPVVVRQDDDLVEAVVEPLERMAEVTGEMGALEPEVVFIGRVGPGDDSGAGGKPRPEQGEQQGVLKAGPEDDGVILVAVDVAGEALFKGMRVPQESVRAGACGGGEQGSPGDEPVHHGTPHFLVNVHFMVEKADVLQVQPVRVFQRWAPQAVHADFMLPAQRIHDARQDAGDSPHAEMFPGDETDIHE